ncbi:hypothetical protein O181_090412 [Austropuccinia psidii MF-1]|uniref:Reverse transcriptase RNase H-like domain-containing protein n=1 Tax=Austropuccinia psidii MF-1 TaxID=1389203 RepID=A0A9Q3IVH3_9BASI|nr:hypothetical protein [Austropuccinia psidii MF-1]
MDQEKFQKILNWPAPTNLKALQSFLGFANFYRHFIKNYSKKISSLTSFLKKDSCFPLNEEALKTNASNYALGAVLSQVSDSGKHPIAFDSCKLIPEELNYEIHDKELLGIVWTLKHWRAFLLSLSSPFEVLTNHSSLQYFMSSKVLTCRQARWAEFLSEFHFSIIYRPGQPSYCSGCLITSGQTLSGEGGGFEQYLWIYFSYQQDYWNTWLPLAEFSYNNSDHSLTKQSPFFTVYRRDPQFDSVHITQDTPAGKLSTKIQPVQQDVKRELEVAINRFKKYADKSRVSPPVFNPGDMVWLSSKNIKSTRPNKRRSARLLGPFPILKKVIIHASISMEIHPSSFPYLPFGTSQDINNPKLASRAFSSNHH